jgi:hypothetical protein
MFELARPEAAGRVAQLEGPQEVARLLEVRANGEDLMDEILHAHNAVLAQVLFDESVVSEWDALLVNLAVSALVNELANGLEIGITVGNVGFDDFQHLQCGLGEADKDTIVDLKESEELENFPGLGSYLVDTRDPD